MKRRMTALLTALLLVLALCVPVMAETDYGLIYDETEMLGDLSYLGEEMLPELSEELGFELRVDVLTQISYDSIRETSAGIYSKYGYGYGENHDGATLTLLLRGTEYGGGNDVYKTTYQLYHANELGMGENRDGIIILLSMDERNYAMFVYGKNAEYAFNKYGQEQLEDAFLGYFGDNDWYGGASHYLDTCDEYLTLAEEGDPVRKNTLPMYLIVVVASCAISGFICIMLKWKMQTVHKKVEADEYVATGGLKLTKQYDRYTHTTETRSKIHDDSDSGGSTSSCSGGGGSGRSGTF